MTFSFNYGGGFTGLNYHFNGDANSLGSPYKNLLTQMATLTEDVFGKSNPLAKDVFKYKLEINDGNNKVSLAFTDDNLPEKFEPLISYLRQKAELNK